MFINNNIFTVLSDIKDTSISFVFGDPPYNLSSRWKVNKNGKVEEVFQSDFMNKWDGLSSEQLETFFKECFRICKYGAYVVLYCIDRQQLPFEYYALKAGFEAQQYLYSYKISNFPKAADVGKLIDKREGIERKIIGKRTDGRYASLGTDFTNNSFTTGNTKTGIKEIGIITEPATKFSKKYDGYKYSISPYKQVLEIILVFKKSCKNKSVLDDIYEYEEGNKEIHPSIINIDGGRVPTDETITNHSRSAESAKSKGIYGNSKEQNTHQTEGQKVGRYPSQLFITDDEKLKEEIGFNTSDILDKQSGKAKLGGFQKGSSYKEEKRKGNNSLNLKITRNNYDGTIYADEGGCSRVNHRCLYTDEEYDILNYCTKVSNAERNAGCENIEKKPGGSNNKGYTIDVRNGIDRNKPVHNNHPTLKSLQLNQHVTKLFIPPEENLKDFTVLNPFAGTGSEYIGLLSNGIIEDNIIAVELDENFYEIGLNRIKYWKEHRFDFKSKIIKEVKEIKNFDGIFKKRRSK